MLLLPVKILATSVLANEPVSLSILFNLLSADSVNVLYPLLMVNCDAVKSFRGVISAPGMFTLKVEASAFVKVIFRVPLSNEAVSNKEPVSILSICVCNDAVVVSILSNLLSVDDV